MNITNSFMAIMICIISSALGQKAELNKDTNNLNTNISKYIPKNNHLLSKAIGDLNLDNIPDIILVLHKTGEDTMYNPAPKRPLLILIGQANGTYMLMSKNENVVYSHDMGGVSNPEPFLSVTIDKGCFTVEHFGGMGSFQWERKATFKYDFKDNIFYLDKEQVDEGKYSKIDSEITSKETLKTINDFGKIPFDKYNIYKTDN